MEFMDVIYGVHLCGQPSWERRTHTHTHTYIYDGEQSRYTASRRPIEAIQPSVLVLVSQSLSRHGIALNSRQNHLWKRGNRIHPNAVIPLRIGLTQSNLHEAHGKLISVSDPDSEYFGKHLAQDEVHALFAPSDETLTAVHS
ncbi:hypothetical protein J3459_012075 [Metarhizium acridum]|nr:hypothetical protein J3459_012075 [Metarhizium acridum]